MLLRNYYFFKEIHLYYLPADCIVVKIAYKT